VGATDDMFIMDRFQVPMRTTPTIGVKPNAPAQFTMRRLGGNNNVYTTSTISFASIAMSPNGFNTRILATFVSGSRVVGDMLSLTTSDVIASDAEL